MVLCVLKLFSPHFNPPCECRIFQFRAQFRHNISRPFESVRIAFPRFFSDELGWCLRIRISVRRKFKKLTFHHLHVDQILWLRH